MEISKSINRVVNKALVFLFLGFGLTSACQNNLEKTSTGIEYQFIVNNAKGQKCELGDILVLDLKYTTEKDSLLFHDDFEVQLNEPLYKGSIDEALAMLKTGDSAIFKLALDAFFKVSLKEDPRFKYSKDAKLIFYIKLKSILSKEDFEKRVQTHNQEKSKLENELLNEYLNHENITVEPTSTGLYMVMEKEGTGSFPVVGQTLKVNYEGKLIDGRIFDSSIKRQEPFEFKFGTGSVIPGWDEAFAKMKMGGKALIVIPSHLAYGEKGVYPLIPPFATLIFEIELINIK